MDSWLTYADYASRYPEDALPEVSFTPLAGDAALFILSATRWTAALADTEEQTNVLRECQARLVHLTAGHKGTDWDGVTSVSNHGYTESYASGLDMQSYLGARQQQIVEQTLSAPATRWMLYRGASYRPPRRR